LPPWAARGRYFEERLGRTLHVNFPAIDKIPDGVATSIKSIDLKAPTYQDAARSTGRLQKYVNEVSEFVGGQMGKDVVEFFRYQSSRVNLGRSERHDSDTT
jgi:hypothetical protein